MKENPNVFKNKTTFVSTGIDFEELSWFNATQLSCSNGDWLAKNGTATGNSYLNKLKCCLIQFLHHFSFHFILTTLCERREKLADVVGIKPMSSCATRDYSNHCTIAPKQSYRSCLCANKTSNEQRHGRATNSAENIIIIFD